MRGVGAGDNEFRCFKWKEDSYNILHFLFFFSLYRSRRMDNKDPSPQIESLDKTDRPVAPDQFEEKYRTTRQEVWAYYSCVVR